MRAAVSWAAAFVVALAAVVGLIAFFNSRDQSGLSSKAADAAAPGEPYRGDPVLSPADEDAVKRGNVLVLYRDARPPAGTADLVPPGGQALVQAGQSVVLDREPTLKSALSAVSAKRIQAADSPQQLRPFVEYWLGG
ncbi:MAG: hypothetical protein ACJ76Z_10895 [Thermoleophilaceae bacterium]